MQIKTQLKKTGVDSPKESNGLVRLFSNEIFSLTLVGIGVLLLAVFTFLFCYKNINFSTLATIRSDVFGQFGDIVGGVVGSLWALAGVILFYTGLKEQRKELVTSRDSLHKQIEALQMQKTELELQRKEHERTRQVFEEQREVFKEQSKTLRSQQFESNFYSLLNIYAKIRDDLASKSATFSFDKFRDELIEKYQQSDDPRNIPNESIAKYTELFIDYEQHLAHYFKVIYRLLRMIENSRMDERSQYQYAKILRSQFLESELFVLYYNSFSTMSSDFPSIALKYNLFKHLPLMCKLGFQGFPAININVYALRWHTIKWLDKFLAQIDLSYDLEVEDTQTKYSAECPHVHGLLISLINDDDIVIDFIFSPQSRPTILFNSDQDFSKFILTYLYDRLFFSRYETIEADDEIQVETINNNHTTFRFTIKTDKQIQVNQDTY